MADPEGAERIEQDPTSQAQESAIHDVVEHVTRGTELNGVFTPEEQGLFSRMTSKVAEVRREHPAGTEINFDFSQNPETYKIWSGLIDRMTRERLNTAEKIKSPLSESEIKQIMIDVGTFRRNYKQEPSGDSDLFGGEYDESTLMIGRASIDPEVGRRFQAHGLAKGSMGDQVRFLNTLLFKGIDSERPFHTAPLRQTDEIERAGAGLGAVGPFDHGGFIVVSELDKSIEEGIAGVLVNEHFYGAIPTLEKHFPGIKFIKAAEAPKAMENWAREKK